MVSPTLALSSSLMPEITKPTSPADNCVRGTDLGVNTPICSHKCVAPVAISRILSLGLSTPLTMRNSMTTPPKLSHHESMIRACKGLRSEEHTSELQSLMRSQYAVFCLKK